MRRSRISDMYNVEQPINAMRRLLIARIGEEAAEELLAEYRAVAQRYQRAVRVNTARYHLERRGDAARVTNRYVRDRYRRYRLLVEHADEYIAGTWLMPRRLEPEATDE